MRDLAADLATRVCPPPSHSLGGLRGQGKGVALAALPYECSCTCLCVHSHSPSCVLQFLWEMVISLLHCSIPDLPLGPCSQFRCCPVCSQILRMAGCKVFCHSCRKIVKLNNILSCFNVRFIDYNEFCHNTHSHVRMDLPKTHRVMTYSRFVIHTCAISKNFCEHITCVNNLENNIPPPSEDVPSSCATQFCTR